jgi:hypothetical protein
MSPEVCARKWCGRVQSLVRDESSYSASGKLIAPSKPATVSPSGRDEILCARLGSRHTALPRPRRARAGEQPTGVEWANNRLPLAKKAATAKQGEG